MTGILEPLAGTAPAVWEKLDDRFDYAFIGPTEFFFRPALEPKRIAYGERFEAAGMTVEVFRQDHGVMDTLGLRVGSFAYSTDVVNLPEESLAALQGLDTWVVGCFQHRPHHVHANLDRVLDWVKQLRPRRTVLIHAFSMCVVSSTQLVDKTNL